MKNLRELSNSKSKRLIPWPPRLGVYFESLKKQSTWFWLAIAAIIVFAIQLWSIWNKYGADMQIPASYLEIADLLIGLNLLISLSVLPYEAYASYLLLGSTLVLETLLATFLFLA